MCQQARSICNLQRDNGARVIGCAWGSAWHTYTRRGHTYTRLGGRRRSRLHRHMGRGTEVVPSHRRRCSPTAVRAVGDPGGDRTRLLATRPDPMCVRTGGGTPMLVATPMGVSSPTVLAVASVTGLLVGMGMAAAPMVSRASVGRPQY